MLDSKGFGVFSTGGDDARLDLGYGTLNPRFQKQRSFVQYQPLTGVDPEAEEEIDPDTLEAILTKVLNYHPGDPYAKKKNDPFYYAGATTKISELSTSKGMVPFPKMYKGKQAVSGGTAQRMPSGPTVGFRTRIRPTGTKKGFSQAPYPEEDMLGPEIRSLEDIISRDPDEDHLNHVRDLIKLIHSEQED